MFRPLRGILKEIVEHKQGEVEERKKRRPLESLQEVVASAPPVRDFRHALLRTGGGVKLLAEIKAASPSAGILRESFDPAALAALYEQAGASAISVLTDAKYFAGADEHLQAARAAVACPVLRKDFTIDPYQVYETRALGADAILLMAQVLDEETYTRFYWLAGSIGLHVLAEGHTPAEMQFLAALGCDPVGINNRDFKTMKVALETTLQCRPLIPPGRVVVSQSGIFHRHEVLRLEAVGVDAIQVGTSLMQQDDVHRSLQRLLGTGEA